MEVVYTVVTFSYDIHLIHSPLSIAYSRVLLLSRFWLLLPDRLNHGGDEPGFLGYEYILKLLSLALNWTK